jgi:nitrogen-specific signal transduction histidine kinase/ActR/RegA family two-component response regulator
VLVINADITQRKELERQFLRSQRLESIGTLAGGIAHDLNNMLAPIVMSLDLLKPRLTDEDGREILETISSSAQRSAELVRQVLWFARGVHGERVPVPLAQLVGELERFISDTFPRNILHRMELSADLPEVNGDATQLHQVLLNLCLNARDAMPAGGTLTLRAERVTVDAPYAAMNPGAVPGEYVALRVEDNGTGIPRETLDRIFEPFFTTKEVGKGTGLGLSTTLGIVKSHGGFVQVDSKPGRGSVFTVNLPAHPVGGQTAGEVPAPVPTHGRGELVLLVDDEESILRISRQALEAFGYRVLTAANGTEALAEFVTHQDEIAVVVTDMMMPEMDGTAVVRALKRMAPKVPVIRSSGLGSSPGGLSMAEDGLGPFLPKPYTAERLLRVLDEVLQREGTPV